MSPPLRKQAPHCKRSVLNQLSLDTQKSINILLQLTSDILPSVMSSLDERNLMNSDFFHQ